VSAAASEALDADVGKLQTLFARIHKLDLHTQPTEMRTMAHNLAVGEVPEAMADPVLRDFVSKPCALNGTLTAIQAALDKLPFLRAFVAVAAAASVPIRGGLLKILFVCFFAVNNDY
jgi:hypothetical protein